MKMERSSGYANAERGPSAYTKARIVHETDQCLIKVNLYGGSSV